MDKSCGACVEDNTDDDDYDDDLEAVDDDNSGAGYHLHHKRSGDQKLKDKAFSLNVMTMPRTCSCGNKCLSKATMIETIKLRENYWGNEGLRSSKFQDEGVVKFSDFEPFLFGCTK